MEDIEPSRLRGAYHNYLSSIYSFGENIPRNTNKFCEGFCIFKWIVYCTILLCGCPLITYYSRDYFSMFVKLAAFGVFMLGFAFLLFGKYKPCLPAVSHEATDQQTVNQLSAQHGTSEERTDYQPAVQRHRTFGFERIFCCCRSFCPTVSAEDQRNQDEEPTAYHLDALHNATDEQTENPSATSQRDAGEEGIALRHRFFSLRGIFCCPRRCCPNVSTEDQRNRAEEATAYHLDALHNATDEQTENPSVSAQRDAGEEGIVLRHRYFSLRGIFCCPRRCCPTVSTEDQRNRAEEPSAYHLDALHNATDEQTENPSVSAQRDAGEEGIVLRHRYFSLRGIFCCPRSCCPTVSTEDQRNQAEEPTVYHLDALHNATDEQTENASATAQSDASEEGIVLRHRFFRLGGIICCPRSCYPTVSTEDLVIPTDEYATSQLASQHDASAEQNVNHLDRIRMQTDAEVLQPNNMQGIHEEVSTKLQIAEKSLLQYLLGSTEEQESDSNE